MQNFISAQIKYFIFWWSLQLQTNVQVYLIIKLDKTKTFVWARGGILLIRPIKCGQTILVNILRWNTDQHFFFSPWHSCVRAALLHPADQNGEAQQLPRGQAGGGGVPQLQAEALQSLPQGRTGRLGEEAYRAGPVFPHHLMSQRRHSLTEKRIRLHFEKAFLWRNSSPLEQSRTGQCWWEERGCQTCGINIPPPFSSLTLLLSASTYTSTKRWLFSQLCNFLHRT